MSKFVALFALAALAVVGASAANAQAVPANYATDASFAEGYNPHRHHAPVVAYAKATKKSERHVARVDIRPRGQAVIPFAPVFPSVHEWEDQDYRGPFQFGNGN